MQLLAIYPQDGALYFLLSLEVFSSSEIIELFIEKMDLSLIALMNATVYLNGALKVFVSTMVFFIAS